MATWRPPTSAQARNTRAIRSMEDGSLDGRVVESLPVDDFQDVDDDDYEEDLDFGDGSEDAAVQYNWATDTHIVKSPGEQVVRLTYVPVENSLNTFWGGAYLPETSRTLVDDRMVHFPDPGSHYKPGRKLTSRYVWIESDQEQEVTAAPPTYELQMDTTQSIINYYGPAIPIAWDGENQFLFTSKTNNCRYYGVSTATQAAPSYATGFGFTTTSTSSNSYPSSTAFVQPKLAPTLQYVDSTSQYQLVSLLVDGTSVSVASTQTMSQTFSSTAFFRVIFALPGQSTFYCYGTNSSGGHMNAECWQITMAPDGSMSTPVSLGMCTPTSSAYAGTFFLNLHNPIVFSDRLGVDPSTRAIFDSHNPTVMRDLDALMPVDGTIDHTRDTFFANPQLSPDNLYVVRRTNTNVYKKIVKLEAAADGSSMTVLNSWDIPITASNAIAVPQQDGTTTAFVQEPSFGAYHVYVDIFGSAVENTDLGYTPTSGSITSVVPSYASDHQNFLAVGNYMYSNSLSFALTQVEWVEVLVP